MGEMKDKVEGKARELKGAVTGDTGEEVHGKAQQAKGNAEGTLNRAGDKARAEANQGEVDARRETDREGRTDR